MLLQLVIILVLDISISCKVEIGLVLFSFCLVFVLFGGFFGIAYKAVVKYRHLHYQTWA